MAKKKIDYTNWSKDELIKELKRIKETTYGLVWHRDVPQEKIDVLINPDARTPEEMFANEVAGKPFPVLKEVKSKEVGKSGDGQTHILIEGDNYHALAVLNFTHQESIDVIYIDPPYNTGNNDFIYTDNFGSDYVKKDDPFRHSKWLSFMEKRLKLAKNLLKETGVIFISIDDNEQAPLKMLCDEIFEEKNFVANIIWQKKYTQSNDAKFFSTTHDYILCYAKNVEELNIKLLPRTKEQIMRYKNPDNDPRGPWMSQPIQVKTPSESYIYEIENPAGMKFTPPKGRSWQFSQKRYEELVADNRIWFGKEGKNVPRIKKFLSETKDGVVPKTIWAYDEVGSNDDAKRELRNILPEITFDSPKPVSLIKFILTLSAQKDSTILDFMAGSGATGHAVLELNKEDGGNRQFILCTNNENNICTDVCHPRLKKVIKGYKNAKGEKVEGLGGNLKYFTAYDFVESEPTDRNKRKLVNKSTEMICIKEGVFDFVDGTDEYKIFKNPQDKYLGIVFYDEAIDEYKKAIRKIKQKVHTYVFSLNDNPHKAEFEDVKDKVVLHPIPEVILRVYKEIFK